MDGPQHVPAEPGPNDEPRRWYTIAVAKNPEGGRDRVRELLADGREFFDCIGADTREDDPRFPVGANVLYALPLTAEEADGLERNGESTGDGNNIRSVDLSVPTEAHTAPTPIPAEATLRYLRADAASIDANVWHGRDVAAAVLDQGTTQAVRDRMGFTLVGRKNFGDPVVDGDELLRSPSPTTENEGFHDHGCLVAPNLIPAGGRLLDALVVTANGNSSPAMFAAAVRWACDQGAKVINYSFGVIGGESQAYVDALTYARDAGVEVFISAGNDGQNTLAAPASYARTFTNVHAIISYDEATNARAPSSNYTFDASGCAPGVGVVSLTPSAAVRTWQGTSCAGPCAASDVVRGCTGGRFSPRQIGAALKANLRDIGQLPIYQGGGAYDLRRALVALGVVTAPGPRRNPSPNPTLEVSGLSGHAAGSNTPAPTLVTSGGRTSAAYGQVTATGSVVQIYGPSSPVVPGGIYCPSVFVRRNRATPPYLWSRVYMQWLTSAGAHISFTNPPYVFAPPDADAWHRVSSIDAVAPAGAALARPMLYVADAIANEVIGFDGWLPEPTAIGVEPYFDGSYPGAVWAGTPHASPSTLLSTSAPPRPGAMLLGA